MSTAHTIWETAIFALGEGQFAFTADSSSKTVEQDTGELAALDSLRPPAPTKVLLLPLLLLTVQRPSANSISFIEVDLETVTICQCIAWNVSGCVRLHCRLSPVILSFITNQSEILSLFCHE